MMFIPHGRSKGRRRHPRRQILSACAAAIGVLVIALVERYHGGAANSSTTLWIGIAAIVAIAIVAAVSALRLRDQPPEAVAAAVHAADRRCASPRLRIALVVLMLLAVITAAGIGFVIGHPLLAVRPDHWWIVLGALGALCIAKLVYVLRSQDD